MLSEQLCKKLNRSPWDLKIPECCHSDEGGDPGECDCCYDEWQKKLESVNTQYAKVVESARIKANELSFVRGRRDILKTWYDELVKSNEKTREICDILDIMLNQMEKVSKNTGFTVDALKILYWMLLDFYRQIDKIKIRYDQLLNCIRCLNEPILVPGQGLMKCIEEYGKKLEAVIATRDVLLGMMLEVISLSLRVDKSLAKDWGLYNLIQELRDIMRWDMRCDDDTPPQAAQQRFRQEGGLMQREQGQNEPEVLLEPLLPSPVQGNRDYCRYIWHNYMNDKNKADELERQLLDLSKEKEAMEACKNSLLMAMLEVDPKMRCK